MHTDARRRLLAARAGAPPSQHAALAFELAAGAFHEGRVGELRGWAEPAVLAAQDDPLLLVGARGAARARRALARRSGDGRRRRSTAPARGLDALDDATLASHPAVPVYVGIAQFLHERFSGRDGDQRPRAGDRAPHRPGPARRDLDRAAGDLAHLPARARHRAARGRGGRGGRAAAGRPAPAALRALDPRARPRRARGGDRGRARRARGHRADGERWSRASSPAPPPASSRGSTTTRGAR